MVNSAIDTKSTDTSFINTKATDVSTTNNIKSTDAGNRVKAYCPGHITGIFTVEDGDPDPINKGSRGLGFCTELGATSEISFQAGRVGTGTGTLVISINGALSEAPVTRRAMEHMLPKLCLDMEIDIQLQAPLGQGFGMSAAGTFATCLAAATHLNLFNPFIIALRATHIAEVEFGAGLGDAMAQSKGVFVHRMVPGVSRMSNSIRLDTSDTEVIFCILGDKLSTRSIIQDPEMKNIILQKGGQCLAEWEKKPDFDNFLPLSNKFARDTGLMTEEMENILAGLPEGARGSMVMLGNTIFSVGGDSTDIENYLADHGKTIRTRVTTQTPYVIEK